MSTIALHQHTATVPAKAKVAAGIALPLSLMTLVGVVVFWEFSWLAWVGVWGAAQGIAGLVAATQILRNDAKGVQLLRYAMLSQVVFTAMKLVAWQEIEAATFGVVALIVAALIREKNG